MFKKYILAGLVLVHWTLNAQTPPRFHERIQELYNSSDFPGFAISILNKDSIIFSQGYGYADKEAKIPFSSNHNQIMASISKTWIGVALMQCVEQGKFSLDTKINDILPFHVSNPKFPSEPILIRHLATHTSSITYSIPDLQKVIIEGEVMTTQFNKREVRVLNKVMKKKRIDIGEYLKNHLSPQGKRFKSKHFSNSPPGKSYKYSNIGSALAAYLVEIVSGISFAEYCETHIVQLLGLTNAGFNAQIPDKSKVVRHYFGKKQKPAPSYSLNFYPVGGLNISHTDLNIFLMDILRGYWGEGKLLTSDSYQVLLKGQFADNSLPSKFPNDETNHGIFWVHRDNLIGHTGGGFGTSTFMFFNKENGVGKVFTTNCELEGNKKLIHQFIRIWRTMDEL